MVVENTYLILKKLVQNLIREGKKIKAFKFFLSIIKSLKVTKQSLTAYEIIYKSLLNIRPILHLQKLRKGSRVFNLPKILNEEQKVNLSLLWFKKSINNRNEKTIEQRLQKEILDCFLGKGLTSSKKRLTYNIILVNRPVLHLLIYK